MCIVYSYSPEPFSIDLCYTCICTGRSMYTPWRSWAIVVISMYMCKHVFICYCSYHCMTTVSYDRQLDRNSFIQATFSDLHEISLPRELLSFHVHIYARTCSHLAGSVRHFCSLRVISNILALYKKHLIESLKAFLLVPFRIESTVVPPSG